MKRFLVLSRLSASAPRELVCLLSRCLRARHSLLTSLAPFPFIPCTTLVHAHGPCQTLMRGTTFVSVASPPRAPPCLTPSSRQPHRVLEFQHFLSMHLLATLRRRLFNTASVAISVSFPRTMSGEALFCHPGAVVRMTFALALNVTDVISLQQLAAAYYRTK